MVKTIITRLLGVDDAVVKTLVLSVEEVLLCHSALVLLLRVRGIQGLPVSCVKLAWHTALIKLYVEIVLRDV